MEIPYHVQSLPSSFTHFQHPDGKLDVQQNSLAQGHAMLYQTHHPQSLQPLNLFSPSEISNNSIPSSQMYYSGYTGSTQMSSPPLAYKKTNLLSSNIPPNLLVKSSIRESDVYYYPSTPPLSASPSISGSPSEYSGLPTPVNATTLYGIHRSEDDVISESRNCQNWVTYGSPPITPIYVQPSSLISNGNANDALSVPCSLQSPTASPLPNQLQSEAQLDFCDPRKLTVCPGIYSNANAKKSHVLGASQLSTSCACPENHKLSLNENIITRDFNSKDTNFQTIHSGSHNFDQNTDFDAEESFFSGLPSYPAESDTFYYSSKRQRTDSDISIFSGTISHSTEPQEIETGAYHQFAINCPLSPPSSIPERDRKNGKRLKKLKKMVPDTTSGLDLEIIKSDDNLIPKDNKFESVNVDVANNTANTSSTKSGVSGDNTKSSDVSKTQQQATRRGRKQSETEDLSKTFVCESCSRRFKRQEHLKRHYRSVHTQEKPFKCHECGKDFSRSDNLSQHARTHGNGSIVVGVLDDCAELPNDVDIVDLGSTLFNTAAAMPGSETSSQCSSNGSSSSKDGQSRKKRRRPE